MKEELERSTIGRYKRLENARRTLHFWSFCSSMSPQQVRVNHVRFTCFGRALLLETTWTSWKTHSVCHKDYS